LFECGIFLGLRVSDLIRLRVGNIRGKKSFEVVEKKTGKKNTITINRHLRETIEVRCADLDDEDYILQSTRHKADGRLKHITRATAYSDVKAIAKECRIKSPMGCHTLRKTFGYQLYQQEKDVAWLMKWFNHSSEVITLIYIGQDIDDKKRVTDRMPFKNRDGIDL